jgi:hypothetical protein
MKLSSYDFLFIVKIDLWSVSKPQVSYTGWLVTYNVAMLNR